MSTVAALLMAKEHRMVDRMRAAGAVGREHARTLEDMGISHGVVLRRLRDRAVIREASGGHFYLDEESWSAVRRSRRRAIHVLWVVALVLLLAVLFSRRAFTG